MSLLITGEVERITEREAGVPGNTWVERTLVLKDWGQTLYVTAGRELSESGLPAVGDKVALEASVRAYVKKGQTEAGFGFTGHRRNAEAEKALYGNTAPARVAAVPN